MTWNDRLGAVGVWRGWTATDAALARTVEELGYGTVWQGATPTSDLRAAEELLDATTSLVVATGVVNIWRSDPVELADSYHRIRARHPGRLLVGIGSGHREATPERVRPLDAMAAYLDVLDDRGVPVEDRLLSALGPKMLAMAAERSAGTHPYLTVPAQTRAQRELLGPGVLVAPEQTVVLDDDPVSARRTARAFLEMYLGLVNYTSTMQRAGFTADDVADGGSDALVDAIVAHGSAGDLAAAVRAHLDAGADHVCIQVQPAAGDVVTALRAVAGGLGPAARR
ncbi:TIGR03620 family F420-dependent LLM class oxidoreductase [Kineosporia sp. R_H_3]|uniref:TIGR03620 family F420-dependent LLM class oxidoreductase n=1 Tax=Kineosporia sp. R_H_3 TaxID=1961848 RepID=UPI000B4B52D0|nr:TIGR03620 family F420-dependent LLM class oxidoreductase [Kineosporia sp. R_H_3]